MSCDVVKRRKGRRISCGVGEVTERLENVALPTSQLILQPFRCFTYVTADSATLLSLLLRHRLFTYGTWRAAHAVCVYHQSVLPKGRYFIASAGTKAAVLPKAGLPAQTQEPRLQFYQGWIGAFASYCFPYPTFSLASEQTLKDLKISQGHQRGGNLQYGDVTLNLIQNIVCILYTYFCLRLFLFRNPLLTFNYKNSFRKILVECCAISPTRMGKMNQWGNTF